MINKIVAETERARANHLRTENARLRAEAAALREALEEIMEEAETDLNRDIILTACKSALCTDAGRVLLERLERERDEARAQTRLFKGAIQEMLGSYTPGKRAKLLALWNQSLKSFIPDVEPECGHLSNLYGFVSMTIEAMLTLAAGNVAREE